MWNSGCWNDWKSSSAKSSSVTTSQPEIHIWPSNMVKWSVKKSPGPTLTFECAWGSILNHTRQIHCAALSKWASTQDMLSHAEPCWNIMSIRMDWPGLCPWHQQASKQLAEVYLRSEGHGITIHGAPYLYWWMYGMFTFSSNYMKRTGI